SRANPEGTSQPSRRPVPSHASTRSAKPSREGEGRVVLARFVEQHCVSCHSSAGKTAGLALDVLSKQAISAHPEVWERVVHKLHARQMPPADRKRPDERSLVSV